MACERGKDGQMCVLFFLTNVLFLYIRCAEVPQRTVCEVYA